VSARLWNPVRDRPSAHRVVIGVDFSPASLAAARWTARHLLPQAELVLVHVVEVPTMPTYLRGVALADRMTERATEMMRIALTALGDVLGPVRCAIDVRSGRPAEQLHEVAQEHEADLLVVGRTGRRVRGVKQLGSTVERLLRRSATPVMVAGGPLVAAPRRILAAVDEGDLTSNVLEWAGLMSAPARSECAGVVTALHVTSDALAPILGARGGDSAAVMWLKARVSECALDCATTEIAVAPGDPRLQILAAADAFESDLVVVGRCGADGSGDTGIGGVARAALRPTTRPVLVIPPNHEACNSSADLHLDPNRVAPRFDLQHVHDRLLRAPSKMERHARGADAKVRDGQLVEAHREHRVANVQRASGRIGEDAEDALKHHEERAARPRLR
jgi:nucleotide-binding universal stress UspA family protein